MLALLVAACFVLAWVARLGWLADYFSRPVLVGYLHGVAVVLVVRTARQAARRDIDGRGAGRPARRRRAASSATSSRATVLVGIVALAALLMARFVMPALPAALIVVVASIVVSWALDLHAHGVAIIGAIPAGLPYVSIPRPSLRRSSTSCRPRSGSSSSASPTAFSPHGASPAGTTSTFVRTRSCWRSPVGAAAGVTQRIPARRERLAHDGERPDGSAHADRRSHRGRCGRARARVLHRADAVPAEGGARRGHRLGGDRAHRPGGVACADRSSAASRSGSPPRRRSASSPSACCRR